MRVASSSSPGAAGGRRGGRCFLHLQQCLLHVSVVLLVLLLSSTTPGVQGRPLVRHIRSTSEFDKVLHKHGTETGMPVIVDFYSDGCGPCRMMAPVFKQLAKKMQDKAVFVKVDTNQMYELSGRYGVRSLPTFLFFVNGKKINEFSGASEQQLAQFTDQAVARAERENVLLTREALVEFYASVGETGKSEGDIDGIMKKCSDMNKAHKSSTSECVGGAATQLARKLKQKYKSSPKLEKRFEPPPAGEEGGASSSSSSSSGGGKQERGGGGKSNTANLNLATKEELQAELEKRLEAEAEARLEEEDDDEAEFEHGWSPGDFPERVTIIGGGPAGMAAAIYAARAGLSPVIVAPPMGGQLQGKGVEVENYPGLSNVTGPAVISLMREQAAAHGTQFETDTVTGIDVTSRPFKVRTNASVIDTHSIIVATGAESNWLGVDGEYELRGSGVSSCATCDGAAFYGTDVVVVGGGDTAMEDALVLARTSSSVTVVHRRDKFRASQILAKRVMEHPKINVRWNATLEKIVGETVEELDPVETDDDVDEVDLDAADADVNFPRRHVVGALVKDVNTGEVTRLSCSAVFVAIGHTPATSFLEGIVEFEDDRPGYLKVFNGTTRTSVPGIFAAGDVADSVYRQAVTSAGSGAAAALDAERWLSEEGLGNEAADFEAELLAELMAEDSNRKGAEQEDGYYNVYEEAAGRAKGVKESVSATATTSEL